MFCMVCSTLTSCRNSCLDPVLTIAASISFRSPFVSPFEKRDEADAVIVLSLHQSFYVSVYIHFLMSHTRDILCLDNVSK